MKLSVRIAAPALALALTGLAAACAPQTSDNTPGEGRKTGTLRVWLFQEVGNAPRSRLNPWKGPHPWI